MRTCPECATPTAAEAATCVVCGARLDQDAAGPFDGGESASQPDLRSRSDTDQTTMPEDIDMTTETTETTEATETTELVEPSEASERAATGPTIASPPPAESSETDTADQSGSQPGAGESGHQPPPVPPAAPPASGAVPPATPPAPGAVPLDESVRNWGLLAHVSGLVSSALVGMGFVGPLVVWLLKRDEHPFVAQNAAEALNFQLSMLLYGALLVVASLPVITLVVTLPLALVGFLLWVILPIVAAVRASRGETWTYPITIGFVRP